jgi:pimeloyl-ACP methyl ester carboxylesterase
MRKRSFLSLGAGATVLGERPTLMVGGYHRIAYTEWGDEWAERTVVCVHGLVRNSRDFDTLADRLSVQGYRAACPDMPGRGESD